MSRIYSPLICCYNSYSVDEDSIASRVADIATTVAAYNTR